MPISTIVTPLFLLLLCCVLHPGQKITIESFEPGRPTARILAERVPEGFRITSEDHPVVVTRKPKGLAFQAGDELIDLGGNLKGLETPMKSAKLQIQVKDGSTVDVTQAGDKLIVRYSADPRVHLVVSGTRTPPQPPPR